MNAVFFRLVNSLPKVYQGAEEAIRDGDEEKGYLLYMRFLNISKEIGKTADYAKDPQYFKKLMSQERISEVVKKIETVQSSLSNRYLGLVKAKLVEGDIQEQQTQNADKMPNQTIKPDSASRVPECNGLTPLNKPKSLVENGIATCQSVTSVQLKILTEKKSTRFLLIDCRFHNDFISAHFKHPNCISIPSEVLERGYVFKLAYFPYEMNSST